MSLLARSSFVLNIETIMLGKFIIWFIHFISDFAHLEKQITSFR
jgi:hypothetical protein